MGDSSSTRDRRGTAWTSVRSAADFNPHTVPLEELAARRIAGPGTTTVVEAQQAERRIVGVDPHTAFEGLAARRING